MRQHNYLEHNSGGSLFFLNLSSFVYLMLGSNYLERTHTSNVQYHTQEWKLKMLITCLQQQIYVEFWSSKVNVCSNL